MKQYSQDKPYSGMREESVIPPGHKTGMNAFEERLVMGERKERRDAIDRYVIGLEGRDGGPKPHDPL